MRECSAHKEDNLLWIVDNPQPGLCRKVGLKCSDAPTKSCSGHGEMVNVEKAFMSRHEAHCPTCAKKMQDGKRITGPRRMGDMQWRMGSGLYSCGSLGDQVISRLQPWQTRRRSAGGSSERDDVHSKHSDGSPFIPGGMSGWERGSRDSAPHHEQQQQPWQHQQQQEPLLPRAYCHPQQQQQQERYYGGNRHNPDVPYHLGHEDRRDLDQGRQENPVLNWVNGVRPRQQQQQGQYYNGPGQYRPGQGLGPGPEISVADSDVTGVLAPVCSWESEMPSKPQAAPAAAAAAVQLPKADTKPLRDKYSSKPGEVALVRPANGAAAAAANAGNARRLVGGPNYDPPPPMMGGGAGGGGGQGPANNAAAGNTRRLVGGAGGGGGGQGPLATLQEASEQYRRGTGSGWTSSEEDNDEPAQPRGGGSQAAAATRDGSGTSAGDEVEAAFRQLGRPSGAGGSSSGGSPRSSAGSGVAAGRVGRRPVSPGVRRLSGEAAEDGQEIAGVRYASLNRRA